MSICGVFLLCAKASAWLVYIIPQVIKYLWWLCERTRLPMQEIRDASSILGPEDP